MCDISNPIFHNEAKARRFLEASTLGRLRVLSLLRATRYGSRTRAISDLIKSVGVFKSGEL